MKLNKLINKLDGYRYIRVYLVEDWDKKIELDASKMVYDGYADDLPICWINYKVKAIIPYLRELPNKADSEAGVMVIIS